jgi:hypothetical protein
MPRFTSDYSPLCSHIDNTFLYMDNNMLRASYVGR